MGKSIEGAEAKSYNFFLSKGYPPHVAAAITGNLKHESGFNVGIEGDKGYKGGSSWGIAQFRGQRLINLKQQYGNNWKNLDNQLAFVDWELNNTEKAAGNALKSAKNIFEAGQIMSDKYERPQLKYSQNKARQKDVNNVFRKFSDPNYVAPEYKEDSQGQSQEVKRNIGEYNTFDYEASKYYDSKETDRLNLTPNVTNFNSTGLNSNFVEEDKPEEKGVSAADKRKEQEAQQILQQKTNEQNFIDDWSRSQEEFIAASNNNQGVQEQAQVQPQEDFTQTFNEISQFVDAPIAQQGGVIRDNAGQWKHPGKVTEIQGNSMATHGYGDIPLYVVPDNGQPRMVMPNTGDQSFPGATKFTEYPVKNNEERFLKALQEQINLQKAQQGKTIVPNFLDPMEDTTVYEEGIKEEDYKYNPFKDQYTGGALNDIVIQNNYKAPLVKAGPSKSTLVNIGGKMIDIREGGKRTVTDSTPQLEEENIKVVDSTEFKKQLNEGVKFANNKVEQRTIDIGLDTISESDYSKLEGEDLIRINKELLSKGYANKVIAQPKNPREVKELQTKLKLEGYDLGKYGNNKDGVDGTFGIKTKIALDKFNEKNSAVDVEAFSKYKRDNFISGTKGNEDFFYINNDEGIKDVQTQYQNKGYFNPNLTNYDFNFSNSSLEQDSAKFNNKFLKETEETKCKYGQECATFVTMDVLNGMKGKFGTDVGAKKFNESNVRGNAWTITGNILKSGGSMLYSVFEDKKPSLKEGQEKSYIQGRLKNRPKFDISNIKEGDIVNMYYGNSGSFSKAYKEGDNIFSTHVGIVKKDKSGKLIVEHNVHEKIYKNNLSDVMSGTKAGSSAIQATAITRPKYNMEDEADGVTKEYSKSSSANKLNFKYITNQNSPLLEKNLTLFQETLSRNKKQLLKDNPINENEYESLEKMMTAIALKESYGNENVDKPGFDATSVGGLMKYGAKAYSQVREALGGTEGSKGFTQMKDEKNLNDKLRGSLLTSDKDLSDPKKSAIASFFSLASKYTYLRDLAKHNNLNLSQEEVSKLAGLSWNSDVKVVGDSMIKYKTYDNIWKAYNTNNKTGEAEKNPYAQTLTYAENLFNINTKKK